MEFPALYAWVLPTGVGSGGARPIRGLGEGLGHSRCPWAPWFWLLAFSGARCLLSEWRWKLPRALESLGSGRPPLLLSLRFETLP